jgi:putative glutamine amidotransferase
MTRPPLILVSPDIQSKGKEHGDLSTSLSGCYQRAMLEAGGLPLTMPATVDRELIAESVRCCDGVMLTGGDDIDSRLYTSHLPAGVRRSVEVTPDGGARDFRELVLIDEVFRQGKPLLAICRGHQVLNVALGGTLVADIPRERPGALDHRRTDRRSEVVHEVRLTPGSLLANIVGSRTLGVNSTHHQAVGRVAPPLRVTAVSQDGIVEGLEWKSGASGRLPWLLSVQFHPERLGDRYPAHQALFSVFIRASARRRNRNL